MPRFYRLFQNMSFQISTVMVFFAFWNPTTTLTTVGFYACLINVTCAVYHVMLMVEFNLVFYIKTSTQFFTSIDELRFNFWL